MSHLLNRFGPLNEPQSPWSDDDANRDIGNDDRLPRIQKDRTQ